MLQFTGERVVPDQMDSNDITLKEHLARYEWAKQFCKGKILDAACGTGYGTKILGAIGMDISVDAAIYAREKYNIQADVYNFECGLPTNRDKFDTIVSFETIEHLDDPNNFLKDCSKNCNTFIFSIPLNNPSKFHKQVYDLRQAQNLIYKYFNKVEWYEQTGTEIKKLKSDNPVFLIGMARNDTPPEADLVLVSHNSKNDLDIFIPSIAKFTKDVTITVVENGEEPLEGALKVENKGYGNACNEGAKVGNSEFVVFLNCDLEATEGWLEELLKPFNDERVAITGARLFSPNGDEYKTPEKDMAIGCVFAMRRKIFEELGGFDENFFLFFEETDMCKRAIKAGYKVVRSEAKMIHYHPHFLDDIEVNPFLKENWDKSKAYFDEKHKEVKTEAKKRILIGLPCGSGFIPAYVVDSLFKLTRPCPTSLVIIERQQVDKARNYIIELAIRMQVDYVFFADDDGVLPADTLVKLLEDDKDIVSAPMMTRNVRADGTHALCCFEKFDFYIGDGKNVNKYRTIKEFDNSNGYLHGVDAVGGACLLIKKKAFEALFSKHNGRPFEWLNEVYNTKEHGVTVRDLSEDMAFSERAKREGFEIWVDTRIRPVHLGKPKFIRFEQEGEKWEELKDPEVKGAALLSENLKSL